MPHKLFRMQQAEYSEHDQHRLARAHRAGSVVSSRPELAGQGRRVLRLGIVTALGGRPGHTVLLLTPASTFTVVVPVLIGGASLVLLVQPRIKRLSPAADGGNRLVQGVALFAVAMYVGYFGAAAGVMLLVVLSMMIDESLVTVNAVKNAVSGMANAMAAACFALFGDVRWTIGGAARGGLPGGRLDRPEDCQEGARRAVPGHRQPVRDRPRGEAWHERIPLTSVIRQSK